jgi:quinol monooxygenase YgiN
MLLRNPHQFLNVSGRKPMIDATIKITVPSEKRNEVLLTVKAIIGQIRREHGCISCNCYIDVEAENNLVFKEEWKTREDLDIHLKSVHFGVLLGTMKLLTHKPDFRFNTIASTVGIEVVKAARAS